MEGRGDGGGTVISSYQIVVLNGLEKISDAIFQQRINWLRLNNETSAMINEHR